MKTIELKVTDDIFNTLSKIGCKNVYGVNGSVENSIRDLFFWHGYLRPFGIRLENNTDGIMKNVDLLNQGIFLGREWSKEAFINELGKNNKLVFDCLSIKCVGDMENIRFSIKGKKYGLSFINYKYEGKRVAECVFGEHIIIDKDTKILIDEIPAKCKVVFDFYLANEKDDFQIKIEE